VRRDASTASPRPANRIHLVTKKPDPFHPNTVLANFRRLLFYLRFTLAPWGYAGEDVGMTGRFPFCNLTVSSTSIGLVLLAVTLTGCGDKAEKQALAQAEPLIAAREYHNALGTLNEGLRQSPKSKALLRERIVLFLHLERADLAFAAHDDMVKRLNKPDTVLLDALSHKDNIVRATAAKALSATKDPSALQPLQKATSDPEEIVRRAAVNALGRMGNKTSTPTLIASLKDSSWFVRSEAATALGELKDASAIEPLLAAISDPDPFVQFAASNAVVALAQPDTAGTLRAHLTASHSLTQTTSALALAKIKDSAGLDILLREIKSSKDPRLRRRCIEGLAHLGDPKALPTLQSIANDRDPALQFTAVTALATIPHPSSLPIVQRIASDTKLPPQLRERAKEAIAILSIKAESKP
jgi:HEAT repeat protein